MFGDDLKKSLEPIKTSDELLEKTRLAIEKARLEQAKASLAPANTDSKKRSSSFGFSWKMVVPIACVLLVVGGAVMVMNYAGKAKKAQENVKVHNKTIDINGEIDSALGGDGKYSYAADTVAADAVEYEDEETEGLEWQDSPVMEETTAAESIEAHNGNSQKSEGSGSMSMRPTKASEFSASVQVDGSLLCISEDHRSLFFADPKTGNPIPSEEKQVPDFSFLSEDQKIQGLNYLENYGLLFVSVGSDQAWSKQSIEHLYLCSYQDGVLQSEEPESLD